MCGIGFFARYKTKKFDLDMIKDTFISLESRGTDASGLYYERIEKIKGKDVIVARGNNIHRKLGLFLIWELTLF